MCGIAGFYHPTLNYLEEAPRYETLLSTMQEILAHRGRSEQGIWLSSYAGLTQSCPGITNLSAGQRPPLLVRSIADKTFAISFDGAIYNTKELKQELMHRGWSFQTKKDSEVVLTGFIEFGADFVKRLNGVFAFAIADPVHRHLYLFRDRSGIKPCFYTRQGEETIFASELKGLLAHPFVKPQIDRRGLNEIFSIGPAKTPGCGVYKDIAEVLPGYYITCSPSGIYSTCYWKLKSRPHEDRYDTTIEKTSWLIQDSIRQQMVSDVPVCTLLSGGVDSSLVSAVCSSELRKQNKQLTTYSFDFKDNAVNFKANAFQPSLDRPYVEQMVAFLDSDHHFLECDSSTQTDRLYDSVLAHDLPCMGDVDSSLLHFCSLIKPYHTLTLTGECADEIFGGYPWFHKKECFESKTFPWTMDLSARQSLLSDDFLKELHMADYVREAYVHSIAETPRCKEDTPEEARRREISWLNLRWFMQTLLDRMDRTSMYSGLNARVPFADHRILEYAWNVPWEIKAKDGVVKHLLRHAGQGLVPDSILFRKKSPYPKTYDTGYERLLSGLVREILSDSAAPVLQFLDKAKVETFLQSPSDYGKPWYGQLMAGPQMLAYLLQINYWLKHYQVDIRL